MDEKLLRGNIKAKRGCWPHRPARNLVEDRPR